MEEQDCGALHYSNLFRMGFTNFLSYENDRKKQLTSAESHDITMETGIEPAIFQLRPNRHHFPRSRFFLRWQLAQRTSHLAISFSMVDQEARFLICVLCHIPLCKSGIMPAVCLWFCPSN